MLQCRDKNPRDVAFRVLRTVLVVFCLLAVSARVAVAQNESPVVVPDEAPPPEEEVHIPAPTPDLSGQEVPDWVARWELARVLSYLDRLQESASEYEKLLAAKPDLQEAQLERINILARLGDKEQAGALLDAIDQEAFGPEEKLLLADAYVQMEEYGPAEEIYRDHLEANPEADNVRLRLAEVLSWNEKYDESIAQYEMLLEQRPEDINLRRKYAFVLIWAGDQQRGAEELQKTLD